MRRLLSILALGAAILPGTAVAGLLPPLPSLDQAGNLDDSGSGAGWYLRGAVGGAGASRDLGNGWVATGAFGYQLGWLRGDVSFDYLGSRDFAGRLPGVCRPSCPAMVKSRFKAQAALANLYYDIGTWNKLTPFLSAGVGGGHLDWGDARISGSCGDACPSASGSSHWRFAWQIGAGLSYAVAEKTSIDADYRLLNLGSGSIGSTRTGRLRGEAIWDSELRVGLRYRLN